MTYFTGKRSIYEEGGRTKQQNLYLALLIASVNGLILISHYRSAPIIQTFDWIGCKCSFLYNFL